MRSVCLLLLLVWTVALGSCTSATESRGVDEVLAFYGGTAVYSKGMVSSMEDKLQGKYYELKLSGGGFEKIAQYFPNPALPASNCAYLFYHALTPVEKKDYDFIRIVIEAQGERTTQDFSTPDLARAELAMAQMAPAVDALRRQAYDQFVRFGNPLAASEQQWQRDKAMLVAVDKQYGRVKEFSLQGFETVQRNLTDGTHELVRLAGVLVREGQSTDFSLVVEPTGSAKGNYLYGFVFSKNESQ